MTTLSMVMETLRQRGHDKEFMHTPDGFTINNKVFYKPSDLVIIKAYRFEGASDPSDNSILYLIEANDGELGYSIDAYGAYSNQAEGYDDFIKNIKMEDREEQLIPQE